MLQVAYTKRPPGATQREALAKIRACKAVSSCRLCTDWRHFKSGLRRRVPTPLQGASTRTRCALPAKRRTRVSFSCSSTTGTMFDKPLRANRGLALASRVAETSSAYRRPVERISAPNSKVLPPAPAQKSITISPRLGPTSKASSWLPSSCTSINPCSN